MNSSQRAKLIIGVSDAKGYIFIALSNILFLKADNSYTEIHLADGKIHTASRLLKYFESELIAEQFIRVHQSYVINQTHLMRYSCRDESCIILSSGHSIPVSRSRRKLFMQSFIRA